MSESDNMRELLKRWRKASGLTQSEISNATGISQGRLSQIESGKRKASAVEVNAIQKAIAAKHVKPMATKGAPVNFDLHLEDSKVIRLKIEYMRIVDAIQYLEFALEQMRKRAFIADEVSDASDE